MMHSQLDASAALSFGDQVSETSLVELTMVSTEPQLVSNDGLPTPVRQKTVVSDIMLPSHEELDFVRSAPMPSKPEGCSFDCHDTNHTSLIPMSSEECGGECIPQERREDSQAKVFASKQASEQAWTVMSSIQQNSGQACTDSSPSRPTEGRLHCQESTLQSAPCSQHPAVSNLAVSTLQSAPGSEHLAVPPCSQHLGNSVGLEHLVSTLQSQSRLEKSMAKVRALEEYLEQVGADTVMPETLHTTDGMQDPTPLEGIVRSSTQMLPTIMTQCPSLTSALVHRRSLERAGEHASVARAPLLPKRRNAGMPFRSPRSLESLIGS